MTSNEIRQLRESLGMTSQEFADKIGVARYTVNRWESGKCNPSPVIDKILMELREANNGNGKSD